MNYLNVLLDNNLKERLDKHSKNEGVLKKKIVELALIDYLNKKDSNNAKQARK